MSWADHFDLPLASSNAELACDVTFFNQGDERRVHFEWTAMLDGSGKDYRDQDVVTSFRPTAVCKRAGLTDRLYVAGWSDTASLIVEEWTIAAVVERRSAPDGAPVVALGPPSLERRLVYDRPGAPARAIACNPWGDQLVLLLDGESPSLCTLDVRRAVRIAPEDAGLVPLLGATSQPFLATARSIDVGLHHDGGLLMLVKSTPAWSESSSPQMLVLSDSQLDGVLDLDAVTVSPFSAIQSLYRDSGWKLDYTEATRASQGIVVSDAPLATQAGVDVLAAGGNAVDAAVATAFALAVVYPRAGNLGGGGFLVARVDGSDFALDFRETAPAAATRDMFEDAALDARVGAASSGVPGSVAGLFEVHTRFGRLPWSEVVAPAERLARDGFVIDDNFHDALVHEAVALGRSPASVQLFMPGGQPLAAGARWSNPDLAATLRRIAQQGPAGFYAGETAAAIAAEMQRGGGLITAEDLAAYRALPRTPLVFEYHGRRVLTTPPPSGGVVLAMLCELLEPQPQPLASLGWHSPTHLHLLAEALRRAFAARNVYLGDPDFTDVPVAMLLSEEWAAPQRASISTTRATPSDEIVPGPGLSPSGIGAGAGGNGHTTHLSVLDAAGNAVSLTTTLNFDFGSGVTVAGAGFLLNNEMDDFASQPGRPNGFGLVQGEANAIAPGKRMLSSMCPIIVTDADGRVLLVAGAAGGPKIITAVFQVFSNVIDFGQDVQAAVAAPRLHHQHQPDRLLLERVGFDAATIAALQALGHRVEREDALADVIAIGWQGDALVGAPDPRRGGAAGSTK